MSRRDSLKGKLCVVYGVIIGFVLLVAASALPSYAQSDSWSVPVNISNVEGGEQPFGLTEEDIGGPTGAWFPDLTVDRLGNLHVVWCRTVWNEFDEGTEYLYYAQRNSQGWAQPNDIVAPSDVIKRNAIAADAWGNLYVTFLEDAAPRYGHGIYFGHAPVEAASSAVSWSDWRFIGGRRIGYTSDLVVDRESNLHLIYVESSEADPSELCSRGNCSDVFYRKSEDEGVTWSSPLNLSKSDPGTKRIGLMVDDDGDLHAYWDEGGDRYREDISIGVAHAVSRDGGVSWSAPSLITATSGVPQQIVAGFDGEGQTIIAWRMLPFGDEELVADENIYYQVSSDDLTWSSPTPIPGIFAREDDALFDAYDMATDSAGNLHFVGSVRLSTSVVTPCIAHLQWDGELWSEPECVSTEPGYPEYPRIAIERGNTLHVVWATRQFPQYTPQLIDIWYSTRRLSTSSWTPVPASPTVLALTPEVTPVVTPDSPTPFPTLESADTGVPTGLYTENDELLQLFVALSPLLLLMFLIVAVKLGWFKRFLP